MRTIAVIVVTAFALAACGERVETTVPTPAAPISTELPAPEVKAAARVVLTAVELRRVCQAGLAEIHGQGVEDIQVEGLESRVVNASWRAPVDGGRRRAQCRVDGDRIVWKPLERLTPGDNRWMDQAGDPVTRFVLDGGTVTIKQTLADGVASSDDGTLPLTEMAG